jgi:hypothetical protein
MTLVFSVELGDIAELLLAGGHQRIDGYGLELCEMLAEHAAEQSGAGFLIGMDAARRLGDNLVNASQCGNLGR